MGLRGVHRRRPPQLGGRRHRQLRKCEEKASRFSAGGSQGRGWNATPKAALERDEYACVLCGTDPDELGRNPDVHHIVPVRIFAEAGRHDKTEAHDLDNVVTLCPGCHRRAEFGTVATNRLRRAIDAR
ncbi:MAG: HNH endonuclease [Haloarculaceae archaeon]